MGTEPGDHSTHAGSPLQGEGGWCKGGGMGNLLLPHPLPRGTPQHPGLTPGQGWCRGQPDSPAATSPPILPLQNIMFLGDFNADCAYVQPSDWSAIRLHTSDVFKWLLPDSADTTVGKSDCAYDR